MAPTLAKPFVDLPSAALQHAELRHMHICLLALRAGALLLQRAVKVPSVFMDIMETCSASSRKTV